MNIVDDKTLQSAKKFFQSKGLEVAGGITYTIDESNYFQTIVTPGTSIAKKRRKLLKWQQELRRGNLDIFSPIANQIGKAKGDKSWWSTACIDERGHNYPHLNPAKKVIPT
ncbi:MAG: hypothetical protein U5K79_21555 [Cyclobacteriaceae bacterium]|nr:hypothetical protein [Cyclobacteriaceae bacterium]